MKNGTNKAIENTKNQMTYEVIRSFRFSAKDHSLAIKLGINLNKLFRAALEREINEKKSYENK